MTSPDPSNPDDGIFLSDTLDCGGADSSLVDGGAVPEDTPLILEIPSEQFAGGMNCGKTVLIQALVGSKAAGPVITAKATSGRENKT